jgi:queuine/archaeosine tRNA-ribosyltransferase
MLLSYANVQFYQELMARTRDAIANSTLAEFVDEMHCRYAQSERDV